MPTLIESIAKISEEKEAELKALLERSNEKTALITSLMEELTRLKNSNFRLKERLKKSSEKYRSLKQTADLNYLRYRTVVIYSSQPYTIIGILKKIHEIDSKSQYEVLDHERNELVGFFSDSIQKIEDNKIFLKHRTT